MMMKTLAEYCRTYTKLTAMQCELLKHMSVCFPFVADLTHAHVVAYAVASQQGKFIVLSHDKPHTIFSPVELAAPGSMVSMIEEPLVSYTLRTGKPVHGKREWSFGSSLDMHTFAIHDNGNVIAVVSFESSGEDSRVNGYGQLLETARLILINARKKLEREMYRSISASDGIIIADKYNRIIFANLAAVRIYKVLGAVNLIGCHLSDRQLTMHITKETIASNRPYEKELEAGGLVLLQRNLPIMEGGQLQRRVVVISDVTEVRQKDKEILIKSAVIQEIHHRVKNNLQTIASLLRLQARRSGSAEVKAALKESVNRILSISVVHEFLSQQDGEHIDVLEITRNILDLVAKNMMDSEFVLETRFTGPDIVLPSKQASNLALIVNELILNALEHAFEHRQTGLIGLDTRVEEQTYFLDLYDDGSGIPADFDVHRAKSLGLQIVRTLIVDDMGGTFALVNDHGTHARITIPRKLEEETEG